MQRQRQTPPPSKSSAWPRSARLGLALLLLGATPAPAMAEEPGLVDRALQWTGLVEPPPPPPKTKPWRRRRASPPAQPAAPAAPVVATDKGASTPPAPAVGTPNKGASTPPAPAPAPHRYRPRPYVPPPPVEEPGMFTRALRWAGVVEAPPPPPKIRRRPIHRPRPGPVAGQPAARVPPSPTAHRPPSARPSQAAAAPSGRGRPGHRPPAAGRAAGAVQGRPSAGGGVGSGWIWGAVGGVLILGLAGLAVVWRRRSRHPQQVIKRELDAHRARWRAQMRSEGL